MANEVSAVEVEGHLTSKSNECALIGDNDRLRRARTRNESTEGIRGGYLQHKVVKSAANDYVYDVTVTPCSGGMCHALQISWDADRAGCLRMLTLLLQCARLRMLMAWCSTLGGAHSSLGEDFFIHAEKAGVISQKQLMLASKMGDPLLAARCQLFVAFSLLQRGKAKQAAKIIRKQYKYATREAIVRDDKLVTMCQAAWTRLEHLQEIHELKTATQQHQEVEIQEMR